MIYNQREIWERQSLNNSFDANETTRSDKIFLGVRNQNFKHNFKYTSRKCQYVSTRKNHGVEKWLSKKM